MDDEADGDGRLAGPRLKRRVRVAGVQIASFCETGEGVRIVAPAERKAASSADSSPGNGLMCERGRFAAGDRAS